MAVAKLLLFEFELALDDVPGIVSKVVRSQRRLTANHSHSGGVDVLYDLASWQDCIRFTIFFVFMREKLLMAQRCPK